MIRELRISKASLGGPEARKGQRGGFAGDLLLFPRRATIWLITLYGKNEVST